MKLGIIGTAGRGPDGERIPALWTLMSCVAQSVVTMLKPDTLVSGGAAVSDHLAVRLYNAGFAKLLLLHLAAGFDHDTTAFIETPNRYDCGRVSNHWHRTFSKVLPFDSLSDISVAIKNGATVEIGTGFKERNTWIAQDSNVLLAFTFGQGAKLAPGGTFDTMTKFLARRKIFEDKKELHGLSAYHFDLNSKILYCL